jgi:hypothetical protein
VERKQADGVLSVFPMIATGDFMLNITLSQKENGAGYMGNLRVVVYVKGNALQTGW